MIETRSPASVAPHQVEDRLAQPVDDEQPPRLPFIVVGIGASAGGLEAVSEFLDVMRPDSGMAFVFIQHLAPDRESLLPSILGKRTAMTVCEVEEGMPIAPNHLYVIRPDHTITINDGALHLGERAQTPMHNRPVDDFYRSLAKEQRERAICVTMSGMGSNGTAGAQAVKAVGGLCVAQDPDTAKFPSMPRSLVESGLADFVLPPAQIPAVLERYASHPYASGRRLAELRERDQRQRFGEIVAILRTRTRHDFAGYKPPTILRRIERRMGLHQLHSLGEYATLLRQYPSEAMALNDDLMIHVTGFFRDPEAWETLRERVIRPLVAGRESDGSVRCWVTACSSGEEAYTLAMLFAEVSDQIGKRLDIKVFATDTAERTLLQARSGTYPLGIESEVTPARLERFFDKDDTHYRVRRELREMVVFAPQNVLQDAPFSRLDICTCRNLLIYLDPETQARVLGLLHFGLREGGVLLLGTSETVAGVEGLFEPIDKKWRIYRRVGPTRHGSVTFPIPRAAEPLGGEPRPISRASVAQITNKVMLDRYTPAAVAVDRELRIVYFHGDTNPFLEQPRGEPTREVLAMVREPLRGATRAALYKAMNEPAAPAVRHCVMDTREGIRRVLVTAAALDPRLAPGFYLVSFEQREPPPAALPPAPGEELSAVALTSELKRVRDELESTVEELQSSNEELKSSNEEVSSINEELQSSNEELETSTEELQSLNEELTTVNAQLQAKVEELVAVGNDLASVLASTDLAVVFLDARFCIRRFTPALTGLFDLIPSDVGRPLRDMARKFVDPSLLDDARAVLARLIPIAKEVTAEGGRWFVRRILPYRTADDRIDGVVIVFIDITAARAAEEGIQRREERLRRIADIDTVGVMFFADNGQIVEANDALLRLVGYSRQELKAGLLDDIAITAPEWREEGRRALAELRATGRLPVYEKEYLRRDGTRFWGLVAATRLDDGSSVAYVADVTQRRRAEATLAQRDELLSLAHLAGRMAWWSMDVGTGRTELTGELRELLGLDGEALIDLQNFVSLVHPEDRARVERALRAARGGEEQELEYRVLHPKDGERWLLSRSRCLVQEGTPPRLHGIVVDITARKRAEHALSDREARLQAIADLVPDLLWRSDARGMTDWHSRRWYDYTGQTPEQSLGHGFLEAIHPDDREAARARFQEAIDSGQPLRQEHRIRRKDGEHRWFLVQATPLRDATGTITQWFAAATDTHEQRTMLEALREGQQRFRLAMEAARMGFFDRSLASGAMRWEPRHNQIMGLPGDVTDGTYEVFLGRIDAADRARVAEAFARAVADRTLAEVEFRVVWGDGSEHFVASHARASDDAAGHPERMIGTVVDITDRKKAEAERASLLEQERLARERSQAVVRMKDELLATLSHELRTPLAAILIWANLLREQPVGSAQLAEGLSAIAKSADAQKLLIDELLDSSRIESGKLRMTMRETDLAALVQAAVETTRPTADLKGVAIEVELSDELGVALADPDRLRQVVWNLVGNAVKFTPAGGRVTVGATRHKGEVEIRVSDNGQGIPTEFLPDVFEPFRQAEMARTRTQGGLGLGLAISRQLVEMHGGTIQAESAGVDQGATFIVRLPLPAIAGAPSPRATGGGGVEEEPRADLRGARVLVVEDDVGTRAALVALLAKEGAEVMVASSAAAAREELRRGRPDVLLSDIGLPGEDGYELLRRVREAETATGAERLPAIALTAFAREGDRARALKAGFDFHLAKPIDPDRLVAMLAMLADLA